MKSPPRPLTLLLAVLLGAGAGPLSAQIGPPQSGEVVVPGASLEKIFGEAEFTEGPAVAPDGKVYFSDLTFRDDRRWEAGHIWVYDPASGRCSIYRSPSNMSNGIEFDASGRMIVAEGDAGRISRTDLGTGKSDILAALYRNRPFNSPNDLALDAAGRIYLTDPRYGDLSSLPQPVRGVYRLDTSGSVTLLIRNVSMPNGIAVSPDQSTLYVGCYDEGVPPAEGTKGSPEQMALLAYDLDRHGNVRYRRTIARYGKGVGPDGLTVDRDGDLYAALRDESRPGIAVYSPSGEAIDFIPTPEVPSNVAFDRPPHDNRLYITAGGGLYRITLTKRGFFPQ